LTPGRDAHREPEARGGVLKLEARNG
jgi:hypothetical protein